MTRVGSGTQPFVGWFLSDKISSGLESKMGSQSTGMVGGGFESFFFFLICVLCVNGENHLVLAIIRLTL